MNETKKFESFEITRAMQNMPDSQNHRWIHVSPPSPSRAGSPSLSDTSLLSRPGEAS